MSAAALVSVTNPSAEELPRVLFVIPGEAFGSSMIFARRQAEALAAMGLDMRIFYLRSRTSVRALAAEFARFRRTLSRFQPAVVHAHFGTMTAIFAAIASGTTPLVVTYRGSDLNPAPCGNGWRSALGRVFSQLAALRADRIVCVSRELRSRLWWSRKRVAILASGVDTTVFRPMPREIARQSLNWDSEECVILFNAGHDPRNKRLDLALAAERLARLTRPNLRLEVLDGSSRPESMPLLMSAADCLLVTSDSEGSPTVVQEALATNLPVVSVPVGDVPERLAGVRNTRIVSRNPSALAHAILDLTQQETRTDGQDHIAELCSERIARELLRIYREASASRA